MINFKSTLATRQRFRAVLPFLLLGAVLGAAPFAGSGSGAALLPAIACLLVCSIFYILLINRNGRTFPYFELGSAFVITIVLYTVYPVISFVLREQAGMDTGDGRFSAFPLHASEVAELAWHHLLLLSVFALGYLLFRGRTPSQPPVPYNTKGDVQTICLYFACIQCTFVLIQLLWNLKGQSYIESYALIANLPTLQRQFAGHVQGEVLSVDLFLLMVLFAYYKKARLFIWGLLLYSLISTFLAMGSRTEFAVMAFATVILYHQRVRPFREWNAILVGVVCLVTLLLYGVLRSEPGVNLTSAASLLPFSGGEFEGVFNTGVDIKRKVDSGVVPELPLSRYVAGLLAVVPQNLAFYQKFDHATWYMETFYPLAHAEGAGMAFGVVSESLIGFGIIELVLRGLVLGIGFGFLHKLLVRRIPGFWTYALYLWLVLTCYQAFRDNSCALIYLGLHRFVIPAFLITVAGRLFSASGFRARRPISSKVGFVRPVAGLRG